MKNVYVYAFATFGHPSDFQQACILPVKNKLPNKIKLFELTHAIKVFPKSELYSIRIENINGEIYISYSKYTYTKELLSDRDGTFIGSSILFSNETPDGNLVKKYLTDFHNILVDKNVKDDRLLINHLTDFTLSKSIVEDFNKINFNVNKFESELKLSNSNSSLVIYSKDNNLGVNYEKAIQLFEKYDTIYFTESKEIAEFAISRGLYKTIDEKDFESEINNLIEERRHKREQSISEFEIEIQRINEDKDRTIQEFNTQIEQNERTHSENERELNESRGDINKIGQFYDVFLDNLQSLIKQLKHNNGKLEDLKQNHNRNKILFNKNISEFKKPNYITTIAKAKPKSNLNIEDSHQHFENKSSPKTKEREKVKESGYKINIYKVVTIVLTFLLLFTWACFLFFKSSETSEPTQKQTDSIQQEEVQSSITKTELVALNPIPNNELNENDYRIVAKSITYKSKIDDVVKVIFDKNPTEIKSNYGGQKDLYSKRLLELNKKCFEEKNGISYFSKDTIKHIPSFKK